MNAVQEAIQNGVCTYYGCSNAPMTGHRRCRLHDAKKGSAAYRSAAGHLHNIRHKRANYSGLPFYDGWDPKKGGSIKAAENWIVSNLGDRPSDGGIWDLHMVIRHLGFVPGNLAWVPRGNHRRQEFINLALVENQQLREENRMLKGALASSF